jgi:hypothetical protein
MVQRAGSVLVPVNSLKKIADILAFVAERGACFARVELVEVEEPLAPRVGVIKFMASLAN